MVRLISIPIFVAGLFAACSTIPWPQDEAPTRPTFVYNGADVLAQMDRSDETFIGALARLGGEIAVQRFRASYSLGLFRGVRVVEGEPPTAWYGRYPAGLLGLTAPTPAGTLVYVLTENHPHAGAELATLLHEGCHVIEHAVHGRVDPQQGGHGPRWAACMEELGLEPARYAEPTHE